MGHKDHAVISAKDDDRRDIIETAHASQIYRIPMVIAHPSANSTNCRGITA